MSKVAIIKRGGSGLGQSTGVRLAKEGVPIVVVNVSEKGGNETVGKVKAHGVDAVFVKADVSIVEEVKNYVDRTVEHFGQIDHFFNNAGISESGKYFLETDIQEIEQIVGINLLVKSRALMVRARLFCYQKLLMACGINFLGQGRRSPKIGDVCRFSARTLLVASPFSTWINKWNVICSSRARKSSISSTCCS